MQLILKCHGYWGIMYSLLLRLTLLLYGWCLTYDACAVVSVVSPLCGWNLIFLRSNPNFLFKIHIFWFRKSGCFMVHPYHAPTTRWITLNLLCHLQDLSLRTGFWWWPATLRTPPLSRQKWPGFDGKGYTGYTLNGSAENMMAMNQYLLIPFLEDEHPFASYFYVHQGYKVLTHCLMITLWQINSSTLTNKKNTHLFSGKQSSKPFLNARISMLIYRRLIMKFYGGPMKNDPCWWSLMTRGYSWWSLTVDFLKGSL